MGLRSPQTQKLDLLRQKTQFLAYEEEDEDDSHFHKKPEKCLPMSQTLTSLGNHKSEALVGY